ncbi:MAG: hypothetical protein J6U93_00485 [Alistipes sp.]|nr:hypothetical protein [Alistipes sp.]
MRKFMDWDNIGDDEIRIIGDRNTKRSHQRRWVLLLFALLVICLIISIPILINGNKSNETIESSLFNSIDTIEYQGILDDESANLRSFCEIRDTTVETLPLRLFIPHNARPTLHKGKIDKSDPEIIYANMAADVRADNGGILGAFVLEGEPLAWGLSRKGYCSIIDDVITVGVAENSPLFERATEVGGYFFRQYPLVDNGVVLIENKARVYNYLRALCQIGDNTFMAHSLTKVSFHNFAQALANIGCDNAIYIVGYEAYGWAVDSDDMVHEFGTDGYFDSVVPEPDNLNYIVWKRK